MEKRRRERLEWNRRTLGGAYDKVGKRDPKWDEKAREAMELAARMFSLQVDPIISMAELHAASKAAVDVGCDDPLLVYLFNRSAYGKDYPGQDENIRRMQATAKALSKSRYPAFRRAVAFQYAGSNTSSVKDLRDDIRKKAVAFYDAALALLPESVKDDERNEFWKDTWLDKINELVRGYRTVGMEALEAYKRVDDAMAKVPELKAIRLRYRGTFGLSYGWEARTQAFARFVPAMGFQSLEECLQVAKKACEEAWAIEPDTKIAELLIDIDKSVGGDRETMELWFDRAMRADGNNRGACWCKLDWLDPKWHGTPEEMLAFGRQCRDTKNWRAGITLLCADAHTRYAELLGEGKANYLASAEVGADLVSVYDEYLIHYPDDYVARSKYASLAYVSRNYLKAHGQFVKLGDHLTSWTEFPYYPLESLKIMRDNCAKAVETFKNRRGRP